MAASLAAAFAEVEGPRLDLAAGYTIPRRKHAPTDERIAAAFANFDYEREIGRIARELARRLRRHEADGQEATHDVFLELYSKHRERLHEDPKTWLGWLYKAAYHRLLDIKAESGRVASIEALTELAGDTALAGARPCVPLALGVDDKSRYAASPAKGEEWSSTQIVGAFLRFADYYGEAPRQKHCKPIHGLPSPAAIRRQFGDFDSALRAAGMVPETHGRRRRRWDAAEAAEECLRFRWRNGRWPDGIDIERGRSRLPGRSTMMRFFGSTNPGEVKETAEAILAAAEAA